MIRITCKSACCGCGACAQACPKSCITMAADEEGFLYPQVRSDLCVGCDICIRVCPMDAKTPENAESVQAYAAFSETDRPGSSSGGIFSVLARWVLSQGGVVFGAAFGDDFSVHHQMIHSVEELWVLRGSKYLQSDTQTTFRQVRELLENGTTVLYTGVSCQIAGLKRYLKKDYPHLYTADVLCHGVPSPKVWKQYLRHQEQHFGSPVKTVNFRGKTFGWKQFSMELSFENGESYCVPHGEDPFMKLFLENICLRPACHSCRFKEFPRFSDLTLGDAWGVGDILPDMDDDGGTSLILVNSEKGQALLEQVQSSLICRPEALDTLLPVYADSRTSVAPHPRRGAFFAAVSSDAGMEKLLSILKGSGIQRAVGFLKRKLQKP